MRGTSRAALALAALATTAACSQGPDAEDLERASTAGDLSGTSEDIGDVLLRDVSIDEPEDGLYEPGEVVRLHARLLNKKDVPDVLLDVETDVAAEARLLVDPDCDGEPELVGEIPLPAEPEVRLPGTASDLPDGPEPFYRIDLLLDEPLRAGQSVAVTFTFAVAPEQTLQVPVEVEQLYVSDDAGCEPADALEP